MPFGIEKVNTDALESQESTLETIDRLFDVYTPGIVFGEPVKVGDTTVITAAEVHVGMGVGFGSGSGEGEEGEGGGGGGGGGGASTGRPIAAIVIDKNGARVEPIVDVTKIVLAFFTTIGALFMLWRSMRKKAGRG